MSSEAKKKNEMEWVCPLRAKVGPIKACWLAGAWLLKRVCARTASARNRWTGSQLPWQRRPTKRQPLLGGGVYVGLVEARYTNFPNCSHSGVALFPLEEVLRLELLKELGKVLLGVLERKIENLRTRIAFFFWSGTQFDHFGINLFYWYVEKLWINWEWCETKEPFAVVFKQHRTLHNKIKRFKQKNLFGKRDRTIRKTWYFDIGYRRILETIENSFRGILGVRMNCLWKKSVFIWYRNQNCSYEERCLWKIRKFWVNFLGILASTESIVLSSKKHWINICFSDQMELSKKGCHISVIVSRYLLKK